MLELSSPDVGGGTPHAILLDITLVRALEDRARLENKMELLGQLAGGIAHDYNNILMVILGYAEMLRRRAELKPEHVAYVDQILEVSRRAADLTKRILQFGRQSSDQIRRFDAGEIVGSMETMLRALMPAYIRLEFDCPRNTAFVRGSRSRLEQAVLNLVVNARDAIRDSGEISVCVRRVETSDGPRVVISVRDTGVGMDEQTRRRIFEPLFTTKENGTGLGLAIVHAAARDFGGYVDVDSQPGAGSTFRIVLPEAPPKPTTRHVVCHAETGEPLRTVLVVEDEEPVRMVIREILATEGWTVLEAGSLREAEEVLAAADAPPSTVLCDLVLPDGAGLQFLRRVAEQIPGIRTIVVSGRAREDVPANLPFLPKPFRPEELTEMIRRLERAV
jgi:CheY-like chemotaxis protein